MTGLCSVVYIGRTSTHHRLRCTVCGTIYLSRRGDVAAFKAKCRESREYASRPVILPFGPGTELRALFADLGAADKPGCNCTALAAEMDAAGPKACRNRRSYFLNKIKENAKLYGQWERLQAIPRAVSLGLASLDACFDEAIRRAVAKEAWEPARNVIYHVCPLPENDGWLRNVQQIAKRWELFNGKRVIAIAQGDGLLPLDEVVPHLPEAKLIEVENARMLREVVSFVPLLREVESLDPNEVTFYAHTKGNSTDVNVRGATRWRNSMYHFLLDDFEPVRRALTSHAFCGTHKITWEAGFSPYPSGLKVGTWMHAGTFFWFRHDRVFATPRWWDLPIDRYAAEAWPSMICGQEQAWSVYQPWPGTEKRPNPYNPKLYPSRFDDA